MQTLSDIAKELAITSTQAEYLRHTEKCSPFIARLLKKDEGLLADSLKHLHISYDLTQMQQFLVAQKIDDEVSLKRVLRKLRQSVLARMIMRDLNGLADLNEVMQTTTQLAETAIQTAVAYQTTWLQAKLGVPLGADGSIQSLIVVGMGKLGGSELNVSSDVDLIFAYGQDGETTQEFSNHEFFNKLGKRVISALDDVTEDGFVFRVDMRLRPFGSEGVLVPSLDALEEYYQNNGREWERYAWIKGRVIAGPQGSVIQLLRPFVYRKYLDFNAIASMRDLKVQIQRDVVKKGMADNIKLGRGGIREIEFIAQVFQLIRGGQDISLQVCATLQVLNLLKNKGLLQEKAVFELTDAYVFLRNLEHRLMYLEDAQTQDLPKNDEAQKRIAKAMQFASWPDFIEALHQHRELVQAYFDSTFSEADSAESEMHLNAKALWDNVLGGEAVIKALTELGYADAENTFNRLQQLHQSHRYKQLPETSRRRFNDLMPLLIETSAKLTYPNQTQPDIALIRSMDFLEAICRRASYLALLAEFPQALQLVVKLCAASAWCAQYLTQHPIVLDELLDERMLYAAPDFTKMRATLQASMEALSGDTERQMDAMRQFKHAAVFRFAAQDIAGQLALETLSDYLSALADLVLDMSLQIIWQSLKFKHREQPKFAVIGYGKLGGKELGYASDLDIIFLYDDEAEGVGDIYARFAQRINSWFNSLTAAGLLYETDLQLRPDGNSGLLVSSVAAFREYQLHRAWTWEHQAITRARFVAGDASIGQAFDVVRNEVMQQTRDTNVLKKEVQEMREKMRGVQHIKGDMFDLKHSAGGIIDVEFIVQYLVLNHSNKHLQLYENIGNIALLELLASLKIIDAGLAVKVADAYRQYRKNIHRAKLQSQEAKVPLTEIFAHQQAVLKLWQDVFQ